MVAGVHLPVVDLTVRALRPMTVFAAVIAVFVTQSSLAAQVVKPVPDSLRMIQSLEPRSGPPGTEVRVFTENLPVQARIHVGVGATHDGFEALAEVQQGMWGEISARVTLPETVSRERALVFIVFNGNFSPLGLSEPFHVTDRDGRLLRRGTLESIEGPCPVFQDLDGYLYGLTGDLGDVDVGRPIEIVGTYGGVGPCGERDVLNVESLAPRPGDNPR